MKTKENRSHGFRNGICLLMLALFATPVLLNTAQAQDKQSTGGARGAVSPDKLPGVVNINTATDKELVLLPGIGPGRAKAILALRSRLGRFSKVEDLMRVRGIGRKTFRKLSPMLVLQGATTLTAKAAGADAGPGKGGTPPPNPPGKTVR